MSSKADEDNIEAYNADSEGTDSMNEVHELARQITNQSIRSGTGSLHNPFVDSKDPALDPNSDDFDSRKWLRQVMNIKLRDPDNYPPGIAGVAFKNLGAFGYGTSADYQKTFLNATLEVVSLAKRIVGLEKKTKITILREFNGLVRPGEICIVLGRPGSGCTTLLKTLSQNTHGFHLTDETVLNYQGIPPEAIHKHFRGEFIYNAETDTHFPHLTVGQTLKFAALARTPKNRIEGVTRDQYATHLRDVTMATFGLSHTLNTKVGDDFIRGVSGGERKRVSLAEAFVNGSALQCWDNSTRGLDSATALEFIKTLKNHADYADVCCFVSLYQASQDAYDLFHKVTVLYEGRQIYFGPTDRAKKFFTDMGFVCPDRQTTGDFLTSLTNPDERIVAPGFEEKVPRTADDFEAVWRNSEDYRQLIAEIDEYNAAYPVGGEAFQQFQHSMVTKKANRARHGSPYTLNFGMQVQLCITRGFQRLFGDLSMAATTVFGNNAMALIVASIFYNMSQDTNSFFSRSALLFFSILMNAFSSALEILVLYAQRPIVEKHTRYAFYHPSAEAFASMLVDMPTKIITTLFFNIIIYFMTNLRREPGPFFIFYLFSFVCMLVMSMVFRTIAACSRTISEAMTPASIFILALVMYTGFAIPTRYMVVWFRWINYINPIGYAFETLMINEFNGRQFKCSGMMPTFENATGTERTCYVQGYNAPKGAEYIDGGEYIASAFGYYHAHKWRNFGILIGFMFFFLGTYLVATELIQAAKSKGEVLVFKKGHVPYGKGNDPEAGDVPAGAIRDPADSSGMISEKSSGQINLQKQTGIFQWMDVCYDIKVKGPEKTRRILTHVDGWVKPGTLTALMGASGAGKTTLLDVLASRVTMGVVTGDMLVNGKLRDESFQRKTGYVQQQDLHLETSTVREALTFSAVLRQPKCVPKEEKIAYVDEVIRILEMESYAEAVVGVPGEGLNVEQRKRLTIGVELAAKPELLLFLDEPTSGLDSQTAWSICSLMRKLANNGQAILCTIHQPSAMLFQQFDRLLFLAKGGRTVYFGDIGENSRTMIDYFERNGADPCPPDANPAEWMLTVIGAAPGSHANKDYHEVWVNSPERVTLRKELEEMAENLRNTPDDNNDNELHRSFASSLSTQLVEVTKRVWQQYWRTPSYIWAKIVLTTISPAFIGFSFWQAKNDMQGLQNQMFAFFMLITIFGNLIQQIMPHFVTQRALYEARERPSKTYSWPAFIISNVVVELPWQTLVSVLSFVVVYYPVGFYRNASWTDSVHERGALFFMLIWVYYLFVSTFAHMVIAGIETADTGGNIGNLLFTLTLLMCGVLATPSALPGFWIFMYRVSPFTYLIAGFMGSGIGNAPMKCSSRDYVHFDAPAGMTCQEYVGDFAASSGGYLLDGNATSCEYCPMSNTNQYLGALEMQPNDGWRNFGILFAYVAFNIFGALFFYWLLRVPKKRKIAKTKKE